MRFLVTVSFSVVLLCVPGSWAGTEGKPQYGTWGFDTAGADLKAKPGDDFFRYANGAWLDRVQIPADKPAYSLRLAMSDLTEQRLHDLMEETAKKTDPNPASIEGKVGAFYKSYMDEGRIEKAGASSLKDQLVEIQSAKTREALAALMGRQNADFQGGVFAVGVDVDIKDPKHYVVYLGQAGLGLPDRDYYLKPDFGAKKQKYQAYAAQLLRLLEWPDADKRAVEVIDFETKIADASWTKTQQRD
ncbi:MAG TPA: M13 family metallopeptidase N-terminal domain-containing protein, partial [Chthoniobacterales bacterium]